MKWWREYRGLLVFFFLMMAFRSAWADWVRVPTGSMNPTILEGDRVLVDKHVYGVRIPGRSLESRRGVILSAGKSSCSIRQPQVFRW